MCNNLIEVVDECDAARPESDTEHPVSYMPTDEVNLEKYAKLQHVLVQLVMICDHLDLSDEAGRGHLKKLLYRILAQPPLLNDLLVSNTLRLLRRLEGRDTRLVERVAEIIAELRSPSLASSPAAALLSAHLAPAAPLEAAPAPSDATSPGVVGNPEPSHGPDAAPAPSAPEALSDAEPGAATASDAEAGGVSGVVGLTVTVAAIADGAAVADPELSPRTKLKQKRYEIQIATIKVKMHEKRMALEAAVQVQDFELAAKLKGTVCRNFLMQFYYAHWFSSILFKHYYIPRSSIVNWTIKMERKMKSVNGLVHIWRSDYYLIISNITCSRLDR